VTRRPPAGRRAPRLGPDQRLAGHITRLGRFRAIDPKSPRPLPSLARVLGVAGWAILTAESLRRARRAVRAERDSAQAPPA
jgi:hypothetical protein